MLLPSSFPAGPRPRLQRFAAYSHEENNSPADMTTTPITPQGVDGTCTALQTMLGMGRPAALKSARRRSANSALHANARILKRPPPKPRSQLKRTRADETSGDDDDVDEELPDVGAMLSPAISSLSRPHKSQNRKADAPSTPKRRRRGPTSVPFGLERNDFFSPDEGIDEDMSEEALSSSPPVPDEGYGSMDIQVDPSVDIFSQLQGPQKTLPRPQLGASFFAPVQDLDAMSMSTPMSDMAAMALSPQKQTSAESSLPITPDASYSRLPPPLVTATPALSTTNELGYGQTEDPELPTLPEAKITEPSARYSTQGYFRPRPGRTPSQTHSDPVDYSDQATPSLEDDSGGGERAKSQRTVYDWTDADDKALVDIVIEKLKLKKNDWDDCAKLLGADNGASLGRRWRELVGEGCVGLKFRYSGVGFTAEDESRSGKGKIRRGKARRSDVRAVDWA